MEYLKQRKSFSFYLFLSLFFHSFLIYLIYLAPKYETSKPERYPASLVEVSIIDSKDSDPLEKSTAKQIVEQYPDLIYTQDLPNENAKFLSKYHQKVLKETASKSSSSINKNFFLKDVPSKLTQETSNQDEATDFQKEDLLPDLSVADLIPKTDWNQYINAKETGAQQRSLENTIDLKDQINSGFQSNDYLRDIEDGQQTLLNTRAFKFYTYYSRIKRQVQASWKLMVKKEVRKLLLQQKESVLGIEQRTSLLITLDRFGALVSVQILKKSHIAALDHIAIKSFQITAPFPHPPKNLIGDKKFLHIRWDFILENV